MEAVANLLHRHSSDWHWAAATARDFLGRRFDGRISQAYNIEMDPHEDLVVAGMFGWVSGPPLKVVEEYLESVKKYPNPPAPNITQFGSGG